MCWGFLPFEAPQKTQIDFTLVMATCLFVVISQVTFARSRRMQRAVPTGDVARLGGKHSLLRHYRVNSFLCEDPVTARIDTM